MTHRIRRNGTARLTLLALAGVAAAATLLAAGASAAERHGSPTPMAQTAAVSAKAASFDAAMNKLWEDHIVWTRMVIVDFAAGLPDLKAAEARLLRNQTDIGNAIKPYYGAAAGNELTRLLRTHILEAVPVLEAAKAGDKSKLTQALATWNANGKQIAAFLTKANPQAWPLAMTTSMMKRHLALTTQEAASRLQGNWKADIAAYDAVHAEILQMASMLSSGIERQFPDRF